MLAKESRSWSFAHKLMDWLNDKGEGDLNVTFCEKSFFSMLFLSEEEKKKILKGGSLFLERIGLFLAPWFPNFNLI